ncbi:MAG: hypothetical protein OXF02_06170 [Simkaniaceae bacterium]|nr:hypothetical protein [Simkaniaceae bacterium]
MAQLRSGCRCLPGSEVTGEKCALRCFCPEQGADVRLIAGAGWTPLAVAVVQK